MDDDRVSLRLVSGDGAGLIRLELAGQDISQMTQSATVRVGVDHVPNVEIHGILRRGLDITLPSVVPSLIVTALPGYVLIETTSEDGRTRRWHVEAV